MLTSNVVYLIIYIIVVIKTSHVSDQMMVVPVSTYADYAMPVAMPMAPIASNFVECQNCHTRIKFA